MTATARGGSLRSRIGRGAAWSTLDVGITRVGQFVLGVVVARLLAPDDFGVFAVALVVHAVLINVSELGASVALIRDDEATIADSVSTVVTISLASSGALGLLMVVAAPVLAELLGSSEATDVIRVMAISLPLAGLTAVPSALLRRSFRMDRLFVANVANTLVTAVVVIALARAGFGPLALAWSWVAGQLAATLLLLTYGPGRVLPGWRRTQARRVLRFGLPLAGASVISFLVLNVDFVVVGRVAGATALGLYVLAFNISGWPVTVFGTVIRSVSLPGFAQLRLDGRVMPEQFLRAVRLVARITFPVCLLLGALAVPLVEAVYGDRWSDASPALVGLSIMGAVRILTELSSDYLIALGRTRLVLVLQVPWLLALTVGLVIGVNRSGIAGAGAAQAVVAGGFVLPIYLVALARSGVPALGFVRAFAPEVVWSLSAAGAAVVVSRQVSDPFVACAAGGAAGVAVIAVVNHRSIASGARYLMAARRGHPVDPTDATVVAPATSDQPGQLVTIGEP